MTIDVRPAHDAGLLALATRLPGGLDALPASIDPLDRLERRSLAAQLVLLRRSQAVSVDATATMDTIVARTGVAPRHRWLLARWLAALTRAGVLERRHGGWRERGDHDLAVEGDLFDDYATLGFPDRLARLHGEALARLDALLRDDLSLSSLLFPDGRIVEALSAYQCNPFTAYVNAACAMWLARCLADVPRPRVLELGGGPGLSTDAVLDALGDRPVDYLFTDISRLFTQAMRERQASRGDLRYGLVDIDRDFGAQDIPRYGFDAIVAGNVLHNAKDIGRSLRWIREALVPGGWLIFTEAVEDNRMLLTSMQFLLSAGPAQARAGSGDRRATTDEVFLDEAAWRACLEDAGFTTLAVLPDAAHPALVRAGQHVFLATASGRAP